MTPDERGRDRAVAESGMVGVGVMDDIALEAEIVDDGTPEIPVVTVLLDVNFLVALAWPNHIHHEAAVEWFEANHEKGWATTPLTQGGFVRVSSNRKVIPDARTPAEAIALLRETTALPGHEFWTDDLAIATSGDIEAERIVGHRQVTDAHLVGLAIRHGGKVASFDAELADVLPKRFRPEELLISLPGR